MIHLFLIVEHYMDVFLAETNNPFGPCFWGRSWNSNCLSPLWTAANIYGYFTLHNDPVHEHLPSEDSHVCYMSKKSSLCHSNLTFFANCCWPLYVTSIPLILVPFLMAVWHLLSYILLASVIYAAMHYAIDKHMQWHIHYQCFSRSMSQ